MPVLSLGQQSRTLGPGVLTVGSAPEAGWRLIEYDLEPVHALFAPGSGGRILLSAGGPQARVYVNGTAISGGEPRALAFGDVVRLGDVAEFVLNERAPDAAPPGDTAYLHDRHRDRLYRLADETSIGRDVGCGVFIQDPEVSRDHACVERRKGSGGKKDGYVVSPSGGVTLLNGDRLVAPAPLKEGDEITVGRTRLRFSWDTPRHGSRPVDAGSVPAAGSILARRAAREATTFMGTLETRERVQRDTRRRIGRRMAAAVAVVALGAAIVASYVQKSVPRASFTTTGPTDAPPR